MTQTAAADRQAGGRTVITAAPVTSGDPRVYTDPYPGAKGSDLVKESCGKCGGDGLYHAPSGFVIQNPNGRPGETFKGCFDCMGHGHRIVKVSSVRARMRRAVKAAIKWEADAAERDARAAAAAAEQFAADWDEAHAEQARRNALNNTPAGQPGDKLTNLAGTVEVATSIEVTKYGGYGTEFKRLVVIKLDNGQVLKTFGAAAGLYEVRRGDSVTITSATVKDVDTYQGQLQTVITRAKLRIDYAALRAGDIAAGDAIQTDGQWYPVLRVDDNAVHIRVELGERHWTSSVRIDKITDHRRHDNLNPQQ
ncbi:hypothetical protein H7I77_25460 [Mycolicibacterium novocastrense]|uniref:Uncharacterized protein n=1 Tax=Mycolicibacterium novocastrense TaxID=59813 RepID=A0AAW5SS40_MYCNV|nr:MULTISPECIES: hypothetical protein [Mycolicibacterium]MCV7026659.1 hypothetical protein [Mycolicibacterium novocastrense]MDX1887925.1 hypothetical protein [Mycolicibacterium sp. 120270]GAT10999.1 uncharacterized protein RMCN_4132 [Mycolicibacterium novocastrense]